MHGVIRHRSASSAAEKYHPARILDDARRRFQLLHIQDVQRLLQRLNLRPDHFLGDLRRRILFFQRSVQMLIRNKRILRKMDLQVLVTLVSGAPAEPDYGGIADVRLVRQFRHCIVQNFHIMFQYIFAYFLFRPGQNFLLALYIQQAGVFHHRVLTLSPHRIHPFLSTLPGLHFSRSFPHFPYCLSSVLLYTSSTAFLPFFFILPVPPSSRSSHRASS